MESTGELFISLRLVLGEAWGLSRRKTGASLARIEWALGRGQKTTYGMSSKKTTVGRSTDLPWVANTTYRRSYFGGARERYLDGLICNDGSRCSDPYHPPASFFDLYTSLSLVTLDPDRLARAIKYRFGI